ncbi:MAG: aromatic amino acid transport family protein [Legionellales bacterium]|jgi:tyrosine-specific transport protein
MTKTFGSILIAAGTAIGAGMIALPLVTAGMGALYSALLFIFVCAVVFYSALLTLEVNLAFKAPRNSYGSMALETLGKPAQYLTSVMYLLLLYALASALISGGASLMEATTVLVFDKTFPNFLNALIFTVVLGSIVTLSTGAVDIATRGLFLIKAILIIAVFTLFLPKVDYVSLLQQREAVYIWAAAPVILTAFGYHIVIPSLAPYLDNDVSKLRTVLLWGSIVTLCIYLLWVMTLLGTLPMFGMNSFAQIAVTNGSVGELMIAIDHYMKTPWLTGVINGFAHVALITTFLGVALSLFDFLRDRKQGKVPNRFKTAVLTFIPPLLVALFYPNGFVQLLSYASIFAAFILIILPAMMAYKMRRTNTLKSPYRVCGGTPMIVLVALIGVGFIIVECLRILGYLPIWTGV